MKTATDEMQVAAGLGPGPGFDRTRDRVRAIARLGKSATQRSHVNAVADSTESRAVFYDDVVQASAHRRPVESHKLVLQTVLVFSDLPDMPGL